MLLDTKLRSQLPIIIDHVIERQPIAIFLVSAWFVADRKIAGRHAPVMIQKTLNTNNL
jgi:hypothetical protein